jgi:hypothetical protein
MVVPVQDKMWVFLKFAFIMGLIFLIMNYEYVISFKVDKDSAYQKIKSIFYSCECWK